MVKNNNKTYTLFAGVNGVGKSTIYKSMEVNQQEERVNSDEILVLNSGDWRNESDQIKAMRKAVEKINCYIKEGISFNQETTLAGRSILGTIKKAKKHDFLIQLYYIGLENADLAVKRVNDRVQKGGHGVEEDIIRNRYEVSLSMLKTVLPLCDYAVIYDNTKSFIRIAEYKDKVWDLYERNCSWFNKAMLG